MLSVDGFASQERLTEVVVDAVTVRFCGAVGRPSSSVTLTVARKFVLWRS